LDREARAWQILGSLLEGRPYLPWTEGALRPAALVAILNEIVFAERLTVVELGSGISTVVIARLIAERGGTLASLEHDPDWAAVVRSQLERESLEEAVELLVAPLEPHPESWDGAPWYAAASIASLPSSIDLLLIDGPPGYGDGMAHSRFPALSALASRLAPGALIVLDDADREPELEIIERWSDEHPDWRFSVDEAIGLALASKA
jgi:predicted O-methyltransferase YrrM